LVPHGGRLALRTFRLSGDRLVPDRGVGRRAVAGHHKRQNLAGRIPAGARQAENLGAQYDITRAACDEYAIKSQARYKAALDKNYFSVEIADVKVTVLCSPATVLTLARTLTPFDFLNLQPYEPPSAMGKTSSNVAVKTLLPTSLVTDLTLPDPSPTSMVS
jgi:hypothetical protein